MFATEAATLQLWKKFAALRTNMKKTCSKVMWLVGLGLLSSCWGGVGGSTGLEGGTCRSGKNCRDGYYCQGPNERRGCGVPPRELCAQASDCFFGNVCSAVLDSCSPDGVGAECASPCNNNSCSPGFRCSASKSCEPIPCDEGATCPSHQRCDAAKAHATGPVHSRTNGCVDISCTADSGCPTDKLCVNGNCQDGAGTCREIQAIP